MSTRIRVPQWRYGEFHSILRIFINTKVEEGKKPHPIVIRVRELEAAGEKEGYLQPYGTLLAVSEIGGTWDELFYWSGEYIKGWCLFV